MGDNSAIFITCIKYFEFTQIIAYFLMKSFVKRSTFAFILIFIFYAEAVSADRQFQCDSKYNVCINYTNSEDIELALNAIKRSYDFFTDIGYSDKYFLKIFFQKKVVVECSSGDLIRVYGKLSKDGHIYLTDWNEGWLEEQNSYGLKMSKEFYESLIIHEVAHFIAEKIAGCKIDITNSEYIAYVVQLSQMHSVARQAMLNNYPLSSFKTEEINLDIMMLNPSAFAVKSYLHFKVNKGKYFKEILNGSNHELIRIVY